MKKKDLKNGNIIVCRSGKKYIKLNTIFHNLDTGLRIYMNDFNEDMLATYDAHCFDIMKVYDDLYDCINNCECLWERKESILDKEEKEYLSAVIKPFINKSIIFEKKKTIDGELEYISIGVDSEYYSIEHIKLPAFKPNTMYKGMKTGKVYFKKDLGL